MISLSGTLICAFLVIVFGKHPPRSAIHRTLVLVLAACAQVAVVVYDLMTLGVPKL